MFGMFFQAISSSNRHTVWYFCTKCNEKLLFRFPEKGAIYIHCPEFNKLGDGHVHDEFKLLDIKDKINKINGIKN